MPHAPGSPDRETMVGVSEPVEDPERVRRVEGETAAFPLRAASGFVAGPSWPPLSAGTALTVVKLAPDGSEVTRYAGTVIDAAVRDPWIAVEAWWVKRRVEMNGLAFETGDRLLEFFSPADPFNVFAVFAPQGQLRGWYANVTYPTELDPRTDPPTLTWHDLYLDVVALPSGSYVVRDEDELAEAGLLAADPSLHAAILAAAAEVLRRFAGRAFPFDENAVTPG